MPFGKRFRLGRGNAAVIGTGDGESNIDALFGKKQGDFSHLSGGSGKIDMYVFQFSIDINSPCDIPYSNYLDTSSNEPSAPEPPMQDPFQKEFDSENPGISAQLQSQPAEASPSLNSEHNPYRLETAEELSSRDPEEVIPVPMIFTVERMGFKQLLGKRETERKITFRKMRRGHYRAHYAKDADGSYIGTEKPAFDAGLVYIHSATVEDVDRQIKEVAYGKQHHASSYPVGSTVYAPA
jgi:hypothetical protein